MKINQNDIIKFLKFVDLHDLSKNEIKDMINKFTKIIQIDSTYYEDINEYIDESKYFGLYDSNDLKEEIDDIYSQAMKSEKVIELPKEEIKEIAKEEKVELPEEEIEIVEKKPTLLDRLFSKKSSKEEVKEEPKEEVIELPKEEIKEVSKEEVIELPKEEIKEITKEEKVELPEEEIEIVEKKPTLFDRLFSKKYAKEYELPKEEIKRIEKENKPIKENKIKAFFKKLFDKKTNNITINEPETKDINNNIHEDNKKDSIKEKQEPKEIKNVSKLSFVEDFVNNNYSNNKEITDFINLIKFRNDKDIIIEDLFNFINSEKANDEGLFLNKLYESFGLSKKEEKPQKKIINSIKELPKENNNISLNNNLNEKYLEIKNSLFDELGQYEKEFINDMFANGLKPGDMELDQMFNERCVNKSSIYKYLLKLESIKQLSTYENLYNQLNDYEKEFIEDMMSENITINDSEFNQMVCERCVNKSRIINYFNTLETTYKEFTNESNNNQKLIIYNYKKNIRFEQSIDLNSKKVSELKEMAKDNDISKSYKLNKKQLIDALNKLTLLKEEEANKKLILIK